MGGKQQTPFFCCTKLQLLIMVPKYMGCRMERNHPTISNMEPGTKDNFGKKAVIYDLTTGQIPAKLHGEYFCGSLLL